MMQNLTVNEIFASLQGESTRAGLPCVFVRLSGCSLSCRWCDTRHASEEPGRVMSVDEVFDAANVLGPRYVTLTGGEPLEQEAAPALAQRFLHAGYTVGVETNGAEDISRLPDGVIRVMDIKCPSSRMDQRMDWNNLGRLNRQDEVKFVIADRADYEFAREIAERHRLPDVCPVLLSPVISELAAADLASWMLFDQFDVRLQLQLHKIIWPKIERGV